MTALVGPTSIAGLRRLVQMTLVGVEAASGNAPIQGAAAGVGAATGTLTVVPPPPVELAGAAPGAGAASGDLTVGAPGPLTVTSSSTLSVDDGAPFTHTLTANKPSTWTIIGGDDQAYFSIDGNTLSMDAKDYDNPIDDADADGNSADNVYVVNVRATAGIETADQTISVTVEFVLRAGVFVDSVNGDDNNDGLSEETALQTLAAAGLLCSEGTVLGLARGSYWREQLVIPAEDITFGIYGSGAMPVLDGADIATGWTQPDAGTYPNVWSLSWTRDGPITGQDYLGLWADGVRPRFASSLSDLQANGGWYVSGFVSMTTAVYIKSVTDPNSSGVLYEIGKRNHGLAWHGQQTPGRSLDLVGPIEIKRALAHYNGLAAGLGSVKKVFLRDGTIHHMVTEGSLTEDVLVAEHHPQSNGIPFTAYRSIGTGFQHEFRRCFALYPGGADRRTVEAFLAHASTPASIDTLTLSACASKGMPLVSAVALNMVVTNCYAEDGYVFGVQTVGSVSNIVTRLMVRDTTPPPALGTNNAIRNFGTGTVVSQSALHVKGGGVINAVPEVHYSSLMSEGSNGLGGTGIVDHCVIYAAARIYQGFANTYVGDNNVFYGGIGNLFHWNSVLYSDLASFQAASGQDANSVVLGGGDQTSGNPLAFWLGVAEGINTGPADGDWRINPGARVYNGAGAALIGTFADGTTPITAAGAQEHYDWNTRAVVAGPPSRYPVFPATIAEMRAYIDDPTAWDFYPNIVDLAGTAAGTGAASGDLTVISLAPPDALLLLEDGNGIQLEDGGGVLLLEA